jgi:hypothetical protein
MSITWPVRGGAVGGGVADGVPVGTASDGQTCTTVGIGTGAGSGAPRRARRISDIINAIIIDPLYETAKYDRQNVSKI